MDCRKIKTRRSHYPRKYCGDVEEEILGTDGKNYVKNEEGNKIERKLWYITAADDNKKKYK